MNNEEKELTIEQETVRDCPILYQMRYRPCTETTMCWGWEHQSGWDEITASTSRQLEVLNTLFYSKYRVRIQADQIKSKYGELRFYYSIVQDPCAFITWLAHKFESLELYLNDYNKFDYKTKKVVDVEPFDYDNVDELSKEDYDKKVADKYKASNVEYKEQDGKYLEICHLRNYGKSHIEPTRLKILWYLKEFARNMYHKLIYSTSKDNAAMRNCKAYLEVKAAEIIRKAEERCANTCELCGHQIGTKWSPTCQTVGWVSYICDDCAEKHNGRYIKNGDLYEGDKLVKTKKQYEFEKNVHELKYIYEDELEVTANGLKFILKRNSKDVGIIEDFKKDENSPSYTTIVKAVAPNGSDCALSFTKHKDLDMISGCINYYDDVGNISSIVNIIDFDYKFD